MQLSNYTFHKDTVGCSSSDVYRCEYNDKVKYLKISDNPNQLSRERDLLLWMKGKLSVPEVLYYNEYEGHAYLLMTKMNGFMSCDCKSDSQNKLDRVHEPIEKMIELLANGLHMLQSVDISECPFENTLDYKLKEALYNINHNLVNIEDFEESNDFNSPLELYQWLLDNRPDEELCFTHGDLCLPNIFIDDNAITGFIDVGCGGIADKWQDIALCVRSLGYNLRHTNSTSYIDLLFFHLGIQPNEEKIRYYILLDELF